MSKIPEGTQFIEAGCGEKGFRKFEKGCWWFFEGYWRHVDWKMGALTLVTEHPSYVAPATPWTGEGLPPVGTVCEFAGGTHCPADPFDKDLKAGMKVEVIAHFKSGDFTLAAFTFDPENPGRGMAQVEQGNFGCFRPIRTAEQIAAEEREAEITEMCELLGKDSSRPGVREQAGILFDAGYRKQVTP